MKIYNVYNKVRGKVISCGSLKSVSIETGINYHTLMYQFSRMGRVDYDNGLYYVSLSELKRSKRK